MRARSISSALLVAVLCAGCNATGVHRKHHLRLHGGAHEPYDDVVRDMSTDDGSNQVFGLNYAYMPERSKIGVEVGIFESISTGNGDNLLPGLGSGPTDVKKRANEFHVGMIYPIQPFWGLETDFGLGLAYIDTDIESKIEGGPEVTFNDQSPGVYIRAASMLPITDSIGLGLQLRYISPLGKFEDTQEGVTFDAELREWQATLFLALSW